MLDRKIWRPRLRLPMPPTWMSYCSSNNCAKWPRNARASLIRLRSVGAASSPMLWRSQALPLGELRQRISRRDSYSVFNKYCRIIIAFSAIDIIFRVFVHYHYFIRVCSNNTLFYSQSYDYNVCSHVREALWQTVTLLVDHTYFKMGQVDKVATSEVKMITRRHSGAGEITLTRMG